MRDDFDLIAESRSAHIAKDNYERLLKLIKEDLRYDTLELSEELQWLNGPISNLKLN